MPVGSPDDRDALLAHVENVSRLGSWAWDLSSNELDWSARTHAIFGYEVSEMRPSLDAFVARVHPEDRERVEQELKRALEALDFPKVDYRILLPNGEVRHIVAAARPLLEEDGSVKRVLGTIEDVTERKTQELAATRSKAQLEEAQSMAKLGSWIWWPDTNEVDASSSAFELVELDPSTPPTMELFASMIHPDDLQDVLSAQQHSSKTGEPVPLEVRVRTPKGEERLIAVRARLVDNDDERYFVGIVQDITELRRLEESAKWSQTLHALGRLSAGVAHDFNNLLMVVLGHARELAEQQASEDLDVIIEAAEAGAELTHRLLAFGREAPAKFEPLHLEKALQAGVRMVGRLIGDDIVVRYEPSETPSWIMADSGLLHRVLLNLAVNSRDAMPAGGVFRISTRQLRRDDQDGVTLEIVDDGAGMDDEVLRNAVSPFFSTKAPGAASGMGLPMVFGVVRQLDGELALDSNPDQGTTVSIWLPRCEPPARGDKPASLGPPRREGTGRAILVVDDERLVRRIIERILTRNGFEVVLASNPEEALQAFETRDFDLVLTDLTMPDGGGKRIVETLRDNGSEVPIVYMTGYALEPADLTGPILLKPFQAQALVEIVDDALSALA